MNFREVKHLETSKKTIDLPYGVTGAVYHFGKDGAILILICDKDKQAGLIKALNELDV